MFRAHVHIRVQEVKIALHSLWYHEIKLIVKQMLCIKLVKY